MKKQTFLTLLATTTMLATAACSHDDHTMAMAKPDTDMQAVLDAQASLNPKPIEMLTPAEARKQPSPADGAKIVMKKNGLNPKDPMGVETWDVTYQGAFGPMQARLYRPKHTKAGESLPVIVYYHGGGFVIADLKTYDASPRAMAKMAHAIVVSVEYSHAPEHKFPASHDDAFAAYRWTLAHAQQFGGDPSRVAVMGESAGGALALSTSVKARDTGIQMPLRQVLVYPVAGVNMHTASYEENANAKPLNKAMMKWFVENEIRNDANTQDPRLDAIGQADLHNLPATTIILAQIDPLRSDGELLGSKLRDSGVDVHSRTYSGVTHEFFGMGAVVGKAKDAESFAAEDLKTSFNP